MTEPAVHVVLRDTRIASGRSQADVAAALGITQTALSYWENGRRDPSAVDAQKWAAVLDCRIAVASNRRSCDCGDEAPYWRGWDDCVATAVQAMTERRTSMSDGVSS